MIYTKNFRLEDFTWSSLAMAVVKKIERANRSEAFMKLLEERFESENDTPSDFEIDCYVLRNEEKILSHLGLNPDGTEKSDGRKTYKVFLRITTTDHIDVKAETPEEAREKAVEEYRSDDDDMFVTILRDDIESVVPVAYDEGDGETKDFEDAEDVCP